MDFYGLSFIMFAGAAIVVLGILVLLFAAFRTSAAWGVASLVVPPLAVAFGITHWRVGRTGVTIFMIGVIIFAYGFYDRERQEKEVAIAKQQQRDAAVEVYTPPKEAPTAGAPANAPKVSTGSLSITAPPAPATTPSAPVVEKPEAEKGERTIINMIDAHKFIGNEIVLTGKNGSVRTGVLAEVRPRSIVLEYKPKGVDTLIRTEVKEEDIELMELKP